MLFLFNLGNGWLLVWEECTHESCFSLKKILFVSLLANCFEGTAWDLLRTLALTKAWHDTYTCTLAPKPECRKTLMKAFVSPQTDAHLDKHTHTQKNAVPTIPPSVKPRRQHLGRSTSKKYDSHSCLTRIRTSCHLSPRISGLINNCSGFVSCLCLFYGTVSLYSICLWMPFCLFTQ